MPRNASGIYTLPGGNPVTPGDVIEADWANTTLEDVADALTNSLSRTGAGGMLAPFRIADGNVSGPGLSYLNETNTGLYRSGSGSTWMAVLGVNVAQFSTVGLTVAAGKALTVLGNASASGTLSVTGATTLASTLAVTGAITATGGVVGNVTGNVTAASGTSTFNDVVITGALDMTAGSSATITGLSTPTNASDAANKGYVDTQDALKLSLTGGTMSGNIAMGGNLVTGLGAPSAGGDATNKTYVDAQVATRLALAGGTMSGAIAMGSSKITGLGTPTADQDAATKAYVDSVAQGLDVKGSCRVATVANISLSGTQTIDGVAVIAGDRVLVKDQSTAANNGIYVVAAGSWSRATDADTWAELVGAFTFVEEGTVNDNSGWVCTSPAGGTLGVTAVTWEQFSGAGQITAGAGLYKSGNTLSVGTASASRIVVNTDDIDLATTGVTASTYKSVTVDAYGRVTAGTNPTTLAGFGIADAYTSAQTDTLLAAKLSLAGGTMTGNLAMGGFKVTGLGAPSNAADAATKDYTDTGLALKLNLTGGTMSGVIAMGANKITGLADPTLAQDAATKNYIDTIFGSTTTAAASAATATTQAGIATTQAGIATTQAGIATTQATNAAASYTAFDNQYLGSKASDPSTNNTGGALVEGNLYWNSTANEMRVYDGAAWAAAYLPASGYAQLAATNTFTANQIISANTSSAALSITQAGSGNALYIEDVAADATPFVVSSTGAVGIGTTTPDNVTSAGIALVSNSGYYPQVVNRNKSADSTASYLVFDKDRAGAVVQNGDALGAIVWRSFDGANYLQSSAIIGYSDGAPGTNDVPGRLAFLTTADGASSPTERFRIAANGAWGLAGANYGNSGQVLTSNGSGSAPTWQNAGAGSSQWTTNGSDIYYNTGNVGIGVSSPLQQLQLRSQNARIRVEDNRYDSGTIGIEFNNGYLNNTPKTAIMAVATGGAYGVSDLAFYASPTGNFSWSSTYERMRINSAGQVSIGSTTSGQANRLYVYNEGQSSIPTALIYKQGGGGGGSSIPEYCLDVYSGNVQNNTSAIYALRTRSDNQSGLENTTQYALYAEVTPRNNGIHYGAYIKGGHGNVDGFGQQTVAVIEGAVYGGTANNGSITALRLHGTSNHQKFYGLQINSAYTGASTQTYQEFVRNNSVVGSITTTTTSTAYNTSSDYRLKENVQPLTGALAKVQQLKPCTYTWKKDGSDGEGFIAHELAEVIPQAVTGEKDEVKVEQYEVTPAVYRDITIPAVLDDDGNEVRPEQIEKEMVSPAVMGEREVPAYQGIDTSFLVATLTAAIQELKAEFDAYKAAHP